MRRRCKMKKVKVGVVGVGALGQHHARVYKEIEGAELVGVYDRNPRQGRKIARKNRTKFFSSMDELAEAVDAVSVAVPTDKHREIGGALLEKGVHLLMEKPIAVTTREAQELVQLAEKNNLVLQVGHIERFNPVVSYLDKKALKTPPKFIEAHRLSPYPPRRRGAPPRGTEVSVVLDLMIHDLEMILHLVKSPVKEIRAVGVPILSSTEDICNARLEFENGAVANVTTSRISPERMRKIRVFTQDSYISLDYQAQSGRILTKGKNGIVKSKVPVEKGDQLTHELSSFVRCVATRGTPMVTGQQASEALKLAVEIIHLCQKHREILMKS